MKFISLVPMLIFVPLLVVGAPVTIQSSGECNAIAYGAESSANSNCITKEAIFAINRLLIEGQGRKLMVLEARLTPSLVFFSGENKFQGLQNEQAQISLTVRNLQPTSVLLTAATFDIRGAEGLRKGSALRGKDVLAPLISLSTPILISPGKDVNFAIAESIVLRGIIKKIENELGLDDAVVIDSESGILANREYKNKFRDSLNELYGKNARLDVVLYEGDYHPITKFELRFSSGGDLFSESEGKSTKSNRLVYKPVLRIDTFLGGYLKSKELWSPTFRRKMAKIRCVNVETDASVPGGTRVVQGDCADGPQQSK